MSITAGSGQREVLPEKKLCLSSWHTDPETVPWTTEGRTQKVCAEKGMGVLGASGRSI